MALGLTSFAFANGGEIPSLHTCDGKDISPAIAWADVPSGARSLALIMDDPDAPDPAAPQMVWVHWILYNLPATAAALPQAVKPEALPAGTSEGPTTGGGPATAVPARRSDAIAISSISTRWIRSCRI